MVKTCEASELLGRVHIVENTVVACVNTLSYMLDSTSVVPNVIDPFDKWPVPLSPQASVVRCPLLSLSDGTLHSQIKLTSHPPRRPPRVLSLNPCRLTIVLENIRMIGGAIPRLFNMRTLTVKFNSLRTRRVNRMVRYMTPRYSTKMRLCPTTMLTRPDSRYSNGARCLSMCWMGGNIRWARPILIGKNLDITSL